ncbi:MAG: hypothetical protein II072_01390 [Clostridia bacterium]|nr:hypothetical protein [Clostridia bacterium]MBQ2110263.1 hypothetical protein [Clostridia bacterium]MBQ3938417.1 hypothetical protein [Clostridia bacterium]
MKVNPKRFCTVVLTLVLLVMSIYVPLHKASAAITYNNTLSATLNCSVSSTGRLNANMLVTGMSGITKTIQIELYVEKRFLLVFWSRVDIGFPNNVWTDSVNGFLYNNAFHTDLSSTGTYRTTVTYTVSGIGGADDVITMTDTVTY